VSSVKLDSLSFSFTSKSFLTWPAFDDLKNTIDDFNNMVPLLELMTNKAMKPRHWARMAEVTGHVFDVESETFQLRNILEAPLLQFKEDQCFW
jgi:dynein heavy chain